VVLCVVVFGTNAGAIVPAASTSSDRHLRCIAVLRRFGSSVERIGRRHPLWQVLERRDVGGLRLAPWTGGSAVVRLTRSGWPTATGWGWPSTASSAVGPDRGTVFFLRGGFLELSGRAAEPPAPGMALWLKLRELAAVRRELGERGVPILREPKREPWGLLEMWPRTRMECLSASWRCRRSIRCAAAADVHRTTERGGRRNQR